MNYTLYCKTVCKIVGLFSKLGSEEKRYSLFLEKIGNKQLRVIIQKLLIGSKTC